MASGPSLINQMKIPYKMLKAVETSCFLLIFINCLFKAIYQNQMTQKGTSGKAGLHPNLHPWFLCSLLKTNPHNYFHIYSFRQNTFYYNDMCIHSPL